MISLYYCYIEIAVGLNFGIKQTCAAMCALYNKRTAVRSENYSRNEKIRTKRRADKSAVAERMGPIHYACFANAKMSNKKPKSYHLGIRFRLLLAEQ